MSIKLYKLFIILTLLVFILIDIFLIPKWNLFSYIRLVIKIVLIIMIFTNNKYTYMGIKFWSIIFLLVLPAVQIVAKIVKYILGGNELFPYKQLVFIIIGIIIYYGAKYLKPLASEGNSPN